MKYANLVIDNKSDQTDQLYTYGVKDDAKDREQGICPLRQEPVTSERLTSLKPMNTRAMGWENGCAISKRWTMMFPSARR